MAPLSQFYTPARERTKLGTRQLQQSQMWSHWMLCMKSGGQTWGGWRGQARWHMGPFKRKRGKRGEVGEDTSWRTNGKRRILWKAMRESFKNRNPECAMILHYAHITFILSTSNSLSLFWLLKPKKNHPNQARAHLRALVGHFILFQFLNPQFSRGAWIANKDFTRSPPAPPQFFLYWFISFFLWNLDLVT